MIFPSLKSNKFGYVNLNLEAQKWLSEKKYKPSKNNPLIDPKVCQKMVDDVLKKYDIDFSYGGWMENRSTLWKGSYLDKRKMYNHLGVDINVATGTEIAIDFDAKIVKVDDDYPEEGGWGPRIILKHLSQPVYLIFAHLDRDIKYKYGDVLKKNSIFAKVGKPPYNGNWFPHLHIQVITKKYYDDIEKNNQWSRLDGYGLPDNISIDAERFPDPLMFISLK